MSAPLASRNLAKHGMRLGAYDGANRRRFVLFTRHDAQIGDERRREFDTKKERDRFALSLLEGKSR